MAEAQKYDLYVIGNAMVDMEWQIEDAFLDVINLKKGTALFLDRTQLAKIIAKLPPCKMRFCGGSGANTALTMKGLGARVFLSCHAAADPNGDFFVQSMNRAGVDTSLSGVPRPPGDTATCMILITADAERSMCACLGIATKLSADNIMTKAIEQSHWLYIEGYQAASDSATAAVKAAIEVAIAGGTKCAMSLSDPTLVSQFRANVESMLALRLELLFCNEEEAFTLLGSENMAKVQHQIIEYAQCCVITLGARGCLCYDGSNWYEVPTKPLLAVDTTGAGDTFAGAVLHALTHGIDLVAAARFGHLAASIVINQFGSHLRDDQYPPLLHSSKQYIGYQ